MSTNCTLALLALFGLAGGVAGCEATFRQPVAYYDEDAEVAPAAYVPQNIWEYPRVPYGGTYAYLVRGQWYYPTDRGWMVFRREPQELSRQRTRVAPPHWQQPESPPSYYGYPR